MWIQTDNEALVRLKTPEIGEFVEFSESGTAQVSEDVGEVLIDKYDSIHKTE